MTAALQGVDVLFLVSASESADRLEQHRSAVAAAAAAGVRHVVYTSFTGASDTATFTLARDHAATERMLRDSGMSWTFLRDNLYMDVLDDFAGLQGVLRGPASDGAVAAIARVDIARVAVTVLLEPAAHAGRIYELSGSQALTLTQVAQQLSEFSDRPVRYEPESVAEAFESRRALGAPDWQVEAWVSTYTAIAAGEMSTVTDTVERLTGIPPMTFAQFLTLSAE